MNALPLELLALWGKTDRDNPEKYHPLLFHLLDVGHVAQALWQRALPQSTRLRISTALGLPEVQAERVAVLLAAQHDLGKASAFQTKSDLHWQRVSALAPPDDNPSRDNDKPHGFVTTKVLADLAGRGVGGWQASKPGALLLAKITGGHHGTFPSTVELPESRLTLGRGAWNELRVGLLDALVRCLFGDQPSIQVPDDLFEDAAIIPLLGGLVSVADWLGSNTQYFPATVPMDIEEYSRLSRGRAARALEETGWARLPEFASQAEFREIFPFNPNPMQQRVCELAGGAAVPYLMIVEAAMGDGKTEAALYSVDRALSTGRAHGFYVAMPTMATGNALFHRLDKDYFARRGHLQSLNFQLVHGNSFLVDRFQELRLAANGPDSGESRLVAESWFTPKKQALLAPFGVGTIDQSLLSVLQTKHWFVRLFGLAGKVVVFDEVHAYDVYMSEILKRLLAWLRALDCTVILLSATLPRTKRAEFLEAWDAEPPAEEAAYPRITFAPAAQAAQSVYAGPSNRPERYVEIVRTGLEFDALARRIGDDLPNGGCGAVICNTVTRAQEAFRTLRDALAPAGWRVLLFHARTTAGWRAETEKEVLSLFGKPVDNNDRPKRCILVATQVVEQSLDLDFDWMASEIAPVDLLLQRMGRLWRHEGRLRPLASPRFLFLCDEREDGTPLFPDWTAKVYDEDLLLRTWIALQPARLDTLGVTSGGALRLPLAIEPLVSAVYDGPAPEDLNPAVQKMLVKSVKDMRKAREEDRQKAKACIQFGPENKIRRILERGASRDGIVLDLEDTEDPTIHETMRAATRLGLPPIRLICAGTDEQGEPLVELPHGTLTKDQITMLLKASVAVNSPALRDALKALEQRYPRERHLTDHRLLRFANGETRVGGHILRLSREMGLVIEKHGKGTEQ